MNTAGKNPTATVIALVLALLALLISLLGKDLGAFVRVVLPAIVLLVAVMTPFSLLMARHWEKAVVLRAGKLHAVRGPGLFLIFPFTDSVAAWVDQRIQTTEFNAEQALTRDTVPANIDAILFWQVHDAQRAATV